MNCCFTNVIVSFSLKFYTFCHQSIIVCFSQRIYCILPINTLFLTGYKKNWNIRFQTCVHEYKYWQSFFFLRPPIKFYTSGETACKILGQALLTLCTSFQTKQIKRNSKEFQITFTSNRATQYYK